MLRFLCTWTHTTRIKFAHNPQKVLSKAEAKHQSLSLKCFKTINKRLKPELDQCLYTLCRGKALIISHKTFQGAFGDGWPAPSA